MKGIQFLSAEPIGQLFLSSVKFMKFKIQILNRIFWWLRNSFGRQNSHCFSIQCSGIWEDEFTILVHRSLRFSEISISVDQVNGCNLLSIQKPPEFLTLFEVHICTEFLRMSSIVPLFLFPCTQLSLKLSPQRILPTICHQF